MPRTLELFDRDFLAEVGCNTHVLEHITLLAVDLARGGPEGRKIGTIFTIGDVDAVLQQSRGLILDPLAGHPEEVKRIHHEGMRETARALALLDGAFVVSATGVVVSACRFLNASSAGIKLPLGLGSRHMAAASLTRHTRAVCVVVSQASVVRIFENGAIVREIVPERWFLRRYLAEIEDARSAEAREPTAAQERERSGSGADDA